MARAYDSDILVDAAGNAWAGALGTIYTDAAASVLATDAYAAASGGSPITTVTTDASGRFSLYFTTPKSYWISWSDNSHTAHPVNNPAASLQFSTFVSQEHQAFQKATDEVVEDFTVADITARNALATMVAGSYCWVTNIDRVYRYDGAAWKPIADVDYVNVLDYGAHWSLSDNSTAFNSCTAAIKTDYNSGGTVTQRTILVPAPIKSAAYHAQYNFTSAWNLRGKAQLRVVAMGSNDAASFNASPIVYLVSTNSNPVIDADNQASSLTVLAGNAFERIAFYCSAATPFVGTGMTGWAFNWCSFVTFADTNAFKTENSFWLWFEQCSFNTASGGANGCTKFSSRNGTSSDAVNCYNIFFRRCRFSGGPNFEYHFYSQPVGANPVTFVFTQCDSENQAGALGMQFLVTRETGISSSLGGIRIENSTAFDPVSGGSPWTTIFCCDTMVMSGVEYLQSGCANANTSQFKQTTPNTHTGWTVRPGNANAFKFVDGSNNPHNGFYGIWQHNRFFVTHVGQAPYTGAGSTTSPDMTQHGQAGASNADLWGIAGDTYARAAFTYDGFLWFGTGASATADVGVGRQSAGTFGVAAGQCLRTGRGATGARPSASTVGAGSSFFDTTLGKPIWSTGSGWVDATGASV